MTRYLAARAIGYFSRAIPISRPTPTSTKQSVHCALFAKAMNWHRQLHAPVSLRASSDYEPVHGLDREPALGECGDERACVTVTLWEDDRGDALGIDRLERVGNRHGRVGTR